MQKFNYFLAFGLMIFFSTSCTEKYKKEIERLSIYADSLENVGVEKDTVSMSYIKAFNAIQQNLQEIKMKERLITQISEGDSETRKSKQDEINQDINAIYDLLLQNRKTLEDLKSQLRNSRVKSTELEAMIANLSAQIEQKDLEISELKQDLARKNVAIENLEKNLDAMEALSREKASVIEQQIVEKNTVWYIIGNKKNLEEKNIVAKEGGFIGIGSTRKISEEFDASLFTRADLRDLKALPVFSKKARLLSIHPSASYQFLGEKNIDSLIIIHPDDFWSASRYLVVMID